MNSSQPSEITPQRSNQSKGYNNKNIQYEKKSLKTKVSGLDCMLLSCHVRVSERIHTL